MVLGGIKLLNILMEFRKGILFVRLEGKLNDKTLNKFKDEVKEVIINAGILYVVVNVNNLSEISKAGINEIKTLKKMIKKMKGEFFLSSCAIKELKSLVNLENELNVFEKVVI